MPHPLRGPEDGVQVPAGAIPHQGDDGYVHHGATGVVHEEPAERHAGDPRQGPDQEADPGEEATKKDGAAPVAGEELLGAADLAGGNEDVAAVPVEQRASPFLPSQYPMPSPTTALRTPTRMTAGMARAPRHAR